MPDRQQQPLDGARRLPDSGLMALQSAIMEYQNGRVDPTRILAYARCVTANPDDLYDLICEAWARAWLVSGEVGGPITTDLVLRYLRVVCRGWMGARRREVPCTVSGYADAKAAEGEDADVARQETYDRAMRQLLRLSTQQRDAIALHLLQGLTLHATARAMSCDL